MGVHFHECETVFNAMEQKHGADPLSDEQKKDVERAGQIGNAAHLVGATGIAASITLDVTATRRRFIAYLPFLALLPALYKYCWRDGYDAFYDAAVDYTTKGSDSSDNPKKEN